MMRSVFPRGTLHLEIEVPLASFNNVYIISFEKLHKEAVDNIVKRQ